MIKEIEKLLKEEIEQLGFVLDEVVYEKENGNYFLRIIIDKIGAVSIEDCVLVTNTINPILDSNDLIKESYILDVCSKEKGDENGQ